METGLKENTASKRKTGIYSGSFNPVHIGHLALANWLCEFTELDELWFLITPHNPLKEKEELMDDRLRYELVKKSIAGYPKFHASDFEFSLPFPVRIQCVHFRFLLVLLSKTLPAFYPLILLYNNMTIRKVTASVNFRILSPMLRSILSRRYMSVLRCM